MNEEQIRKQCEEQYLIKLNETIANLQHENEARVDYYRDRWRMIANIIIATVGNVKYQPFAEDSPEFEQLAAEFTKYVTMGKHFETLMTAVEASPSLKTHWDEFLFLLKVQE